MHNYFYRRYNYQSKQSTDVSKQGGQGSAEVDPSVETEEDYGYGKLEYVTDVFCTKLNDSELVTVTILSYH